MSDWQEHQIGIHRSMYTAHFRCSSKHGTGPVPSKIKPKQLETQPEPPHCIYFRNYPTMSRSMLSPIGLFPGQGPLDGTIFSPIMDCNLNPNPHFFTPDLQGIEAVVRKRSSTNRVGWRPITVAVRQDRWRHSAGPGGFKPEG